MGFDTYLQKQRDFCLTLKTVHADFEVSHVWVKAVHEWYRNYSSLRF